ncbi:hypothetical protein CLU79DRAFT_722783 [Phycomyces nitens]|nr:hypothetical protein CLU79DRAFT_722783 [Phycomyces nitens]
MLRRDRFMGNVYYSTSSWDIPDYSSLPNKTKIYSPDMNMYGAPWRLQVGLEIWLAYNRLMIVENPLDSCGELKGRDLCANNDRAVEFGKSKILNLENYTGSKIFHDVLIHINNDKDSPQKGDNPPKANYCGEDYDQDILDHSLAGNRTFYSHKVILCGASGWFKKLLEPEKGATPREQVVLKNVDPEVFETLLCCVYSSELLVDDFVGAMDLLGPAREFGFKTLCSQIMKLFRQYISYQNVWLIWSMALQVPCTQTEAACRKFFEENPVLSLKDPCWLGVKSFLAVEFISMDTFTKPVDESVFFEAALAWRAQNMEWVLNKSGQIHEQNVKDIEKTFFDMIRCSLSYNLCCTTMFGP